MLHSQASEFSKRFARSPYLICAHVVEQVDLLERLRSLKQLLDSSAGVDGAAHVLQADAFKCGLYSSSAGQGKAARCAWDTTICTELLPVSSSRQLLLRTYEPSAGSVKQAVAAQDWL